MTHESFYNADIDRADRIARKQERVFFWAFCAGLPAGFLAGALTREILVQWNHAWRLMMSFSASCVAAALMATAVYLVLWRQFQLGRSDGKYPHGSLLDGWAVARKLAMLIGFLTGMLALLGTLAAIVFRNEDVMP